VEARQIEDALAVARRWRALHARRGQERRKAERLPFYDTPTVVFDIRSNAAAGGDPWLVSFKVWGRDISEDGFCFLTGREVLACLLNEEQSAFVRLKDVVRRGKAISIGFPRPDGATLWLDCEVVRVRCVYEELFEVGVRFLQRRSEFPPAAARLLAGGNQPSEDLQ
jgi:hypothetical protein